ncbi:sigma-70 family RNA polymerase sigma factor [bacterium]|nr:sigma-70 family RNA polymerase sigma factor [bacterium]
MPLEISILPPFSFFATTLLVSHDKESLAGETVGKTSAIEWITNMPEEKHNAESDDLALLASVGRGDRQAFSEFYDRFSRPIYTLTIAILHSQTEAEDALQEVMTKIWGKASSYNPRAGKPLSWVMTLTRNHAIDRLRSLKRNQELKQEAQENEILKPIESDTRKEAERRETGGIVRTILGKLPTDQRQAIELAYFRGLTHTEIATTLNQPIGTIKARIRRGMLRMRDDLNEAR